MHEPSWFPSSKGGSERVRLFCFPSAGKSPAAYTRWPPGLPSTIDVLPAQLPGRGTRYREPSVTHFPTLVELLAQHIEPLLDVPFAFFGHSLGALVAFELARALRNRNAPVPVLLIVAARSAPHLRTVSPLYQLPSELFLEAIQNRYGAFDDEIKNQPEVLKWFEPILRADFTLFDTYVYSDRPPLDCPIVAYGGSTDHMTAGSDLQAWERHTSKEFSARLLPGSHFFFEKSAETRRLLLSDMSTHLGRLVGV